jgi:hypothetical protein
LATGAALWAVCTVHVDGVERGLKKGLCGFGAVKDGELEFMLEMKSKVEVGRE